MGQRLQVVSAIAEFYPQRIWGSRDRHHSGQESGPHSLGGQSSMASSLFWCHQQVRPGSLRIWVFFSQTCWEKVSIWQSIWPHHVTGKGNGEPQLGPGWGEHKTWPSESSGVHIPSQEEVYEGPCVLWGKPGIPLTLGAGNQCSLDRGLSSAWLLLHPDQWLEARSSGLTVSSHTSAHMVSLAFLFFPVAPRPISGVSLFPGVRFCLQSA